MADFVHLEWGRNASSDGFAATVIVDCLSFSTATSVACGRGARVVPVADRDEGKALAVEIGGVCAGKRREGGYSLSPPTLMELSASDVLVLPSPNGATLSALPREGRVFAAALRNAVAVAAYLKVISGKVLLVAAGEKWPDGSLRPTFEDQLACGALAHMLDCAMSPEASIARAGYLSCADDLLGALKGCASGQELTHRGYTVDVEWAADLDSENCVPELRQVELGGKVVNAFIDVSRASHGRSKVELTSGFILPE
ncbi:2-phosphosulfolactate phosphatase [Pseudovibrio sp. Ad13]|uniref:2-phosphosulfolactate phosphatase n=1 Tax=Pseudovibrio sp. Ad13 TaxID=989396 RepID=UPI0007AE4093|nr:2-phosphosulfolactate phosphatase [Pseudovibrio sp. Ad13]KZK79661.1 2-phosphosulfolactate phosphatase [Pseudovibrio sp. Ad13]